MQNAIILTLVLGFGLLPLSGCQTTQTDEDGTEITEYDPAATRAMLQVALEVAQDALTLYQQAQADAAERDDAEYAREVERREQRIEALRELIEALPDEDESEPTE